MQGVRAQGRSNIFAAETSFQVRTFGPLKRGRGVSSSYWVDPKTPIWTHFHYPRMDQCPPRHHPPCQCSSRPPNCQGVATDFFPPIRFLRRSRRFRYGGSKPRLPRWPRMPQPRLTNLAWTSLLDGTSGPHSGYCCCRLCDVETMVGLSSGNVVGDVLKKLQIYGERFPSQLPFKR